MNLYRGLESRQAFAYLLRVAWNKNINEKQREKYDNGEQKRVRP